MNIEPIRTERLLLRKFLFDDAADVQAYGDLGIEYIPGIPHPYTLEEAQKWVQGCIDKWDRNERYELAIEFEGKVIGGIGVHEISERSKRGYIGYAISKEHRRKGLAYEAVSAFINELFHKYGFERLMASIMVDNIPSQHFAEKLGFVREALFRKHSVFHGERVDMIEYGLLIEEWSS